MSRYRLIGLFTVVALFIVSCAPTPAKQGSGKVLLITQETSMDMELMLSKEVGVMVDRLEKAGFDVIVASDSGQPITGSSTTLTPDLKLADVNVDDYVGIMLPCMASLMDNPRDKSVEIVKTAIAQGKPIAAQDYGVYILALAGALNGKKYAISSEEKDLIYGGVYKGEGVVQDGNIITSGVCPFYAKYTGISDYSSKLTQKFIDTLISRQ